MYAALESLPSTQQARLATLTGRHRYARGPGGASTITLTEEEKKEALEFHHPAVEVHPVSGRAYLFVNAIHTLGFVGMSDEEGWALVNELMDHGVQPQFVYHHQWRIGDLVLWDERSTMHRGAGDHAPQARRVMLRIMISRAGNI